MSTHTVPAGRALAFAGLAIVVLTLGGLFAPKWLLFLLTMAFSHGLAVLGVVHLTRAGGATFGQGMFFAIGAYTAALLPQALGVHDAIMRVVLGTVAAGLVAVVFAPLLARYRGIFFAMLTLALSMVLFGLLSKANALGGSDGISVSRATLLGMELSSERKDYALFLLTAFLTAAAAWAMLVHWHSAAGLVSRAVRANALRVEYLGASARASLGFAFVVSAMLGGLGGSLTALVLGHVEPNMTNWTTSGEFVFVAVLAGYHSVVAVFVASVLLEIVRSFSNLYFPNTWQMALGLFLLLVIMFRPDGLGSFWVGRRWRKRDQQPRVDAAETASSVPAGAPGKAVS